jgi:tetratricopeptide (TPR) repeat protein/uncharacterized membrane protein
LKKSHQKVDAKTLGSTRAPAPPLLSVPLLALLVGLLTFALYLPSLSSGFVYDAEAQILIDPYIHDRSHFSDVLSFRVLAHDVLDGNRPVQLLSLMVDSLLWGKGPFGYHLTSNLLHACNAALLFLVMLRLATEAKGVRWAAAVSVLLFAAHPLLVEPVAEVSCREDLLANFFVLAAVFLAMFFSEKTGRSSWWSGSGCLLAVWLACGSKETGVIAPVLILLYWRIFRRQDSVGKWLGLTVLAMAVAGLFFAARFALQPSDSQIFLNRPEYLGGSLEMAMKIQPRIWVFSIGSIFWPAKLSAVYGPQDVLVLSIPWTAMVLAAFLLIQAVAGWKSRIALFGAAVFWLGLAPVSNLIPIYRPVADRYLYLPLAGLAITVFGFLVWVSARKKLLPALLVGGACLGLVLVSLAWRRQAVFANSLNLWADTFAKSPYSDTAANNLGYALLERRDYRDALKKFESAVRLAQGKKPNAWAGAALALEKLGQPSEAQAALRRAIEIDAMYANPPQLVKSLLVTPEQAAVLAGILQRSE